VSDGPLETILPHPDADAAKERLLAVAERIATFRHEIKPELTQAINDYLRTQSSPSAAEKKQVEHQVDYLLKGLGFAIEHSGRPCALYACSGKKDPKGRFRIQPWDSKKALVHSVRTEDLLPLALIDTIAARQFAAQSPSPSPLTSEERPPEWRNRVRGGESGKGQTP